MNEKRRAEDQRGWIGRNISVGDWIAISCGAIGIVGAYYSLDGKANENKNNIKRIEVQQKEDVKEIKQLLLRMDDKLDRLSERK